MDENFEQEFITLINKLGELHQTAIKMQINETANAIYGALSVAQNEYLKLKLN